MQERDAVVPSERAVGDERCQRGQQVAIRRDRFQARRDLGKSDVPQFAVEKPARDDDREKPDEGPNELTRALHRRTALS
jgi:hypothetical protein